MTEQNRKQAVEAIIEREGMSIEEAESLGYLPGEPVLDDVEADEAFDKMVEEELKAQTH